MWPHSWKMPCINQGAQCPLCFWVAAISGHHLMVGCEGQWAVGLGVSGIASLLPLCIHASLTRLPFYWVLLQWVGKGRQICGFEVLPLS